MSIGIILTIIGCALLAISLLVFITHCLAKPHKEMWYFISISILGAGLIMLCIGNRFSARETKQLPIPLTVIYIPEEHVELILPAFFNFESLIISIKGDTVVHTIENPPSASIVKCSIILPEMLKGIEVWNFRKSKDGCGYDIYYVDNTVDSKTPASGMIDSSRVGITYYPKQ